MANNLLQKKRIRKGTRGSFNVPRDFSAEGKRFAQSVVDNLQQLTGEKGDDLDRAVTFNDLINAGIAKKQFLITEGGSDFVIGQGDEQGVETPTAPSGASASGAFQNVLISWDYPSYAGHSHTEIFVSTTNDFASIEISKGRGSPKFLGQTTASVFTHQVSQGQTRFYFIRHVNRNDVAGPAQSTSGLSATTSLINTSEIADNLITAAKIVDGAVSTAKIATDAVTNAKIAVDAIQGDVIAAGAITTAKIGADAITTTKIADDAISTPKISANAITASEIASNAITSVKIDANAITSAKIAAGAVTATEIASDAVTAAKIQAGAVNADKIAANSVAASKMVAGTITAASGIIGDAAIVSAKIADGAIVNAKIADATIDNAKITNTLNASKIVAGQMNADRIKIDNVTLDTDGSGNLIIATGGVGDTQLGNISATKITAGQLDSARINADTLNVKHFADTSADIINQTNGTVPLAVYNSANQFDGSFPGDQQNNTETTFLPITVNNVRNGATYQVLYSAVLGDTRDGKIQYCFDSSFSSNVTTLSPVVSSDAGTFRTYVFMWQGTITGLSSSQETVYWRINWIGGTHNSTYQSMYVYMDNTT